MNDWVQEATARLLAPEKPASDPLMAVADAMFNYAVQYTIHGETLIRTRDSLADAQRDVRFARARQMTYGDVALLRRPKVTNWEVVG
jgi:hypothetical protein